MGRKLDVDELVSATEIAERLHLGDRNLVNTWRKRYADFPQPVLQLSIGLVYYWPDVETWALMTSPRRDVNTRHTRRLDR